MDAKRAAEAALFSSAEGLRISEISQRTGIPEEDIRTAVMDLRREYDERDSAIMISKVGSEYRMMLRTEYSDFTGKFAKAEMPAGVMRTLSTIAYNQPVLQSALLKTRGPRTYDDVHRLIEMGEDTRAAHLRRRPQTHRDGLRVRQEVRADPGAHDHQQVLRVLRHRLHKEVRHKSLDRGPGEELAPGPGRVTRIPARRPFPSRRTDGCI